MGTSSTIEELERYYTKQVEELRAELKEYLSSHSIAKDTPIEKIEQFVQDGGIDSKLVKFVALYEATPAGLAKFVSSSSSKIINN